MTPAIRHLEQEGIDHEVLHYRLRDARADASGSLGEAVAEVLELDPAAVFKTLIVALDTRGQDAGSQLAVALVPVRATLDLKMLSRAAGAKSARLADKNSAERATGYLTGGISPLGQKKCLPTYVAQQIRDLERMYVSGGRRGLEIGMAPGDLVRACKAQVCALTLPD